MLRYNWLSTLQILHFALLLATGILFGIYYHITDGADYFRSVFDFVVMVFGAITPVVTLVFCVIHGDNANLRSKVIGNYRSLLLRSSFLLASNVILATALSVFVYITLVHRNVTILVSTDASLYLNDGVGINIFVGEWKKGQSQIARLPTGQHTVIAKDPLSGKTLGSQVVDVAPPWRDCDCDRISLTLQTDPFVPIEGKTGSL